MSVISSSRKWAWEDLTTQVSDHGQGESSRTPSAYPAAGDDDGVGVGVGVRVLVGVTVRVRVGVRVRVRVRVVVRLRLLDRDLEPEADRLGDLDREAGEGVTDRVRDWEAREGVTLRVVVREGDTEGDRDRVGVRVGMASPCTTDTTTFSFLTLMGTNLGRSGVKGVAASGKEMGTR